MRAMSQGWSWPYRSSTKATQANSSTWRISFRQEMVLSQEGWTMLYHCGG